MDNQTATTDGSSTGQIEARIGRYTPRLLSPELWAEHGEVVRDLVRCVRPKNTEDAKNLLVVLCRFTKWAHGVGTLDHGVRAALREPHVAAYLASTRAELATGTRSHEATRLWRIYRHLHHLPPAAPAPKTRPRHGVRTTPYPADAVDLRQATNHPDLAATVILGLGLGIVVPDLYRAKLEPAGSGWAVTVGNSRRALHPKWERLASIATPQLDHRGWRRARSAARRLEVGLDSHRLRRSWAVELATSPFPLAEFHHRGLSDADLLACARAVHSAGETLTLAQLRLAR
jgi:hypothetical protein